MTLVPFAAIIARVDDEAQRVLAEIEDAVDNHGGDLGGWTKLDDDALQLFDGRATLRASVAPPEEMPNGGAHVHIVTTFADEPDAPLDACVMGLDRDRDAALRQAAARWTMTVAGPIKSWLDGREACSAARADGQYGLPAGLKAYVGPALSYGSDGGLGDEAMRADLPWFAHLADACAPRRLHLAKASVSWRGDGVGWMRELEVDGHDAQVKDARWPAPPPSDLAFGFATRFAVVETPDADFLRERAALDDAIEAWLRRYREFDRVDALQAALVADGHDERTVAEVEQQSTIAFGRAYFDHLSIAFPTVITRVRGGDRIERNVPLASLPAFNRGLAVFGRLARELDDERVQAAALYSAESSIIVQYHERTGGQADWSSLALRPLIVPDADAAEATIRRAVDEMQGAALSSEPPRRPWWKFW